MESVETRGEPGGESEFDNAKKGEERENYRVTTSDVRFKSH